MKIYECCPFNNENFIASIKIAENKSWVDELHITECDRTFKYGNKGYTYDGDPSGMVKYHKMSGKELFKRTVYRISRTPWFIKKNTFAWHNEEVQRNVACSRISPEDDDIVILSDIDEIIDSSMAEKVIYNAKRHNIITIKIHFSLYYFNLFSSGWGGAPDYSYRVFIMTGKYFNKMKMTSNELRYLGTHGKLIDEIYCMEEFAGFHHSWLGDEEFIKNKVLSYAHAREDHDPLLFDNKGSVNVEYIKKCLKECKSIFGDQHKLHINNSIKMLGAVEALRNRSSFQNMFVGIPNEDY